LRCVAVCCGVLRCVVVCVPIKMSGGAKRRPLLTTVVSPVLHFVSVLQLVAVSCRPLLTVVPQTTFVLSVLQCVGVLRCVVVCCGVLQCVAGCCKCVADGAAANPSCITSVLQCVAVCCRQNSRTRYLYDKCCGVLQCVAVCCSALQRIAV